MFFIQYFFFLPSLLHHRVLWVFEQLQLGAVLVLVDALDPCERADQRRQGRAVRAQLRCSVSRQGQEQRGCQERRRAAPRGATERELTWVLVGRCMSEVMLQNERCQGDKEDAGSPHLSHTYL